MGLALQEADPQVKLFCYLQVLVMLWERADEGAVVGAQLGDVRVLAGAECGLAIAG